MVVLFLCVGGAEGEVVVGRNADGAVRRLRRLRVVTDQGEGRG